MVAREYRLIDQDAISVLVPYDRNAWTDLKTDLRDAPLHAGWIRRARPQTVSLYRPKRDARSGITSTLPPEEVWIA